MLKFVSPNPTAKKPGKAQILIMPTFLSGLRGRTPSQIGNFETFFIECEALIRDECVKHGLDQPESSAIGRARGDWYEWLFSIGNIEFILANKSSARHVFIPLPNKDKFDYLTLYNDTINRYFSELRDMLGKEGVTLSSSNPDFAVVRMSATDDILPSQLAISEELITQLGAMCKSLVGRFSFEEFIGFVSVKTSVRGDRRLQLPAEAALVKAYYEHLKARMWKTNSAGLKYYAVSMEFTDKDMETLQTAALHSIISVNTRPEKAVDQVWTVSNSDEMTSLFRSVLV